MKRSLLLLAALIIAMPLLRAGEPRFTYADIAAGKFAAKGIAGLRTMADGERYTVRNGSKVEIFRYSDGALQGTLLDGQALDPQLRFSAYELSPDEGMVLLTTNPKPIYRHSFSADYMVLDRASGKVIPLTTQGAEQQAAFSPDGKWIGFVRDNDLYVVAVKDFSVKRITHDGKRGHVINGLPDWVYEEEYGLSRAFAFSPDGSRIAWLRFDESRVREFSMMTFAGKLYPEPYTYKYPKAGEVNSTVTLHVQSLEQGTATRVDAGQGEFYIPRIGFTPGGQLWFLRTNRLQNRLDLLIVRDGGIPKAVYSTSSPRYVQRPGDKTITFLSDGFVAMDETSGYNHLYYYALNKKTGDYERRNAITSGEWDVASLIDITGGQAYYLAGDRSPMRRTLCATTLDGKRTRRLTSGEGNYSIAPSRGFRYFISTFSNVSTPPVVTLNRGDGSQVRVLEDNAALRQVAASVNLPRKEFFTCPGDDGTLLNAYIIRPEGFDPAKKYPVMMTQYSGPGSQQVLDRWSMDWEDVLVQHGYVVVCVDPRGTGMRGEQFRSCTYLDLGRIETLDQIAAARWLQQQEWVDPARIGIYGWSYGGFMSLNCILKGADVFRMAIAVAPVTSWRFYDSIYTEIYNGLPQDNPRGYDQNSPINFADRLCGKLLMIHGSGDDNVHVQNSYEMARALVRAGKQFDMMIYPDDNHSMVPSGRTNVRQKMVEYTLVNL